MTDDIVTRLREGKGDDIALFGMMYEAADEIERLRAENNKASALIAKLAQLLLPYSLLMTKHEQDILIKAVRGD